MWWKWRVSSRRMQCGAAVISLSRLFEFQQGAGWRNVTAGKFTEV